MPLQVVFQDRMRTNRYGDTGNDALLFEAAGAAAYSCQPPPWGFKQLAYPHPADRLQTVVSMIRSASEVGTTRALADRQPATASRMFSSNASRLSR